MTKDEYQAKRQAHQEALTAFRAAVDEHKAGKPEGAQVSAEEWREKASEKLRKARADFIELQNELIGIDSQAEIVKAEEEFKAWENRPVSRLPVKDPADADTTTPEGEPEKYESRLEREAFSLEKVAVGPNRSQASDNMITAYRNEAKSYTKLGLNKAEHEAYRDWFRAHLCNHPSAMYFHDQKLREAVRPEKFALLTSVGSTGGFLVSEDFSAEVLRDLPGYSVFRQVARIQRTGKDVLVMPTVVSPTAANLKKGHPSKFAGGWGSQADQGGNATLSTQTQPRFEQERIQVHRYQPEAVELALETIEDPDADVEALLAEIMAETRGIDENVAFTEGTGADRPLGITKEALTSVSSGSASTLAFNPGSNKGLLGLVGTLPPQYARNATLMMNSLTYTTALGLENATATTSLVFPQIGQPMISGSMFGALMTFRVAFNEIMPDIGSNTYPIIFGDFARGYVIADRMELRVQRLIEKVAPNVAFLAVARIGGQTVRTGAFVRQKCAA